LTAPVRRDRGKPRWQLVVVGAPSGPETDRVLLPGTGLSLPPRLNFERWLGIGKMLSATHTSSAWCLGDWLVYGETAFNGRYREAIEETSLDYQTLRNYAWVARRFELSRRRDNLSFGHHAEVAALPETEQDFWLRKAEDHGWSRNELRKQVHFSLDARGGAVAPDDDAPDRHLPSADLERLQLKVTPEQLELCRAAADKAGVSVEIWAVNALDYAARGRWSGAAAPYSR
jgi:hypothetical protein